MPDGIELGTLLDNVGSVGLLIVFVWLMANDRLVSGRRLRRAEGEIERWQNVALEAMGAAKAIVPVAETVDKLVAHVPASSGDGDQRM